MMQIYQNIEKKDYILKSLSQLIQSSHCRFQIKTSNHSDPNTFYETASITVEYLTDPIDYYKANGRVQSTILVSLIEDYIHSCPPNPTIFEFNLIGNAENVFNDYFNFDMDSNLYINEYNLGILKKKFKDRKSNVVLINIIMFVIKLGYFYNWNYFKDTLLSLFRLVLLLDVYLIICFILRPNNYFLLVLLMILINLLDEKRDYVLIEKRMKPDGIYLFFILCSYYIDDTILFLQLLSFTVNFILEIIHGKMIRSLDERADYFIYLYREYGLYLQIFINSLFILQPITISYYYNNAINLFLILVNFVPILPNKKLNKIYILFLLVYFIPENHIISQKQVIDYNMDTSIVEITFSRFADTALVLIPYKSKEIVEKKLILETEYAKELEIEPNRIIFPACATKCTFDFPYYEHTQFHFNDLGLNTVNNTVSIQMHDHVIGYQKEGDEIEIRISCTCPHEIFDGDTIHTRKNIL